MEILVTDLGHSKIYRALRMLKEYLPVPGGHTPDDWKELGIMTHGTSYDDSDHRRFDPEVCFESIIPQHPMGIKPTGNQFVAANNIKATAGILSCLPDELLIQLLESLELRSLLQLGATCKALYGFSRFEDIWRTQFLKYAISPRRFYSIIQVDASPGWTYYISHGVCMSHIMKSYMDALVF